MQPQVTTEHTDRFDALYQSGNFDEAEHYCNVQLQQDPNDITAISNLALLQVNTGKVADGIAHAQSALKIHSTFTTALLALATGLLRIGKVHESEQECIKALETEPSFAEATALLAQIRLMQKNTAQADALFQKALQQNPTLANAHANYANLLMQQGKYPLAIEHAQKAIAIKPFLPSPHFILGVLFYQQKKPDQAEAALGNTLKHNPHHAQALRLLGELHMHSSNAHKAMPYLEKSYALQPQDMDLLTLLAQCCVQCHAFEKAREHYAVLLKAQPNNAAIHNNMARLFRAKGDMHAAYAHITQSVTAEPGQVVYQAALASIALNLGKIDEAREACHAALNIDAHYQLAHEILIRLHLTEGNAEEALSECDWILERTPYHVKTLAHKTIALEEAGNADEASILSDYDTFLVPNVIEDVEGYDSVSRFNDTLAECITSHPTLQQDPEDYTTKNGWHTGELQEDNTPCIQAMCTLIKQHVRTLIEGLDKESDHPFIRSIPEEYTIACWAVRMGKQGHQMAHVHHAGWVSGVYYVKVPSSVAHDAKDKAGWIEFGRGEPEFYHHNTARTYTMEPKEGTMLLFPSYFWHRTIPISSDEERISFAFDIVPTHTHDAPASYSVHDLASFVDTHNNNGHPERALAHLQRALHEKPDHPQLLVMLGTLYSHMGDMANAEQTYSKALRIDPNNAILHYHIGLVHAANGKRDDAMASYRHALTLDPSLSQARHNLGNMVTNLPNIDVKIGNDKARSFNGTWYRGENTNFQPSKANLEEPNAIADYVLKGWAPGSPFINKEMTITTFGSCFARNITRYLMEKGYNVSGQNMHINSHVIRCGEGMVNSYAILQQFEWAYENRQFCEHLWHGSQGEIAAYTDTIRQHTREVFEQTDIFIITLGLSEVWYNKQTGDVFWRAIPAEQFDPEIHGFRIATYEENVTNLQKICSLINKHRPNAKIVFTLSPIPLNATFRPVSCITANSVSKSILRAAIDDIVRNQRPDESIYYYPSYEIVKEFHTDPYIEDNRHVKDAIITTIMRTFEQHYCT